MIAPQHIISRAGSQSQSYRAVSQSFRYIRHGAYRSCMCEWYIVVVTKTLRALYANKGATFAIAKFNFLNFILKAHLSTFMGVFTDNFITSYHYSNSHFYITSQGEYSTYSMALLYGRDS